MSKIFEEYLQSCSEMKVLNPQLDLRGSIQEGTRLSDANEIDVTITFNAPSDHLPLVLNDVSLASDLKIPENSFLNKFQNEFGSFSYSKFIFFLCEELQQCLKNIDQSRVPTGLTYDCDWKPCPKCQVADENRTLPLMHCSTCAPAVTYTKLGPCLLFKWKDLWGKDIILSMDIIPTFPLQYRGNADTLFQRVISTLYHVKPDGWRTHCQQVSQRDRLLLDDKTKSDLYHKDKDKIQTEVIALKLLNHNEGGSNFIVRPGQNINSCINETNLVVKHSYTLLKLLKSILGISISSFLIKKSVLHHARLFALLKDTDKGVSERKSRDRLVQMHVNSVAPKLLSHLGIYKAFQEDIDCNHWRSLTTTNEEAIISGYIPIKTGQPFVRDTYEEKIFLDFFHLTTCQKINEWGFAVLDAKGKTKYYQIWNSKGTKLVFLFQQKRI